MSVEWGEVEVSFECLNEGRWMCLLNEGRWMCLIECSDKEAATLKEYRAFLLPKNPPREAVNLALYPP